MLREVHAWRETVAERMDRAPFMVLGNEVLLSFATDPPKSVKEIAARKGVGERIVDRHGKPMLEAVRKGVETPKEEWPRVTKGKRWHKDDDYEDRLKRLKQVRDKLTTEHDLRPGIVAANQMLSDIARTLPGDLAALAAMPGMRNYQVAHFGSSLLSAL
ncbi:MAG: HRDC domain-containing protein [Flavobacteriales bacterium]|nr:HRDC domain-containing protein [Flavobacteriales bacterium]